MGPRHRGPWHRLRLGGRRGRRGILAAVVELDTAEAAVVEFAAAQAFEQVQKTCLHLVDFVAFLEFGDAESAAARTTATVAEMVLVSPRRCLHGLASLAPVFRHETEPLDECPMHTAQFAAAPRALLVHVTVISQFARRAQQGRQ